jgi:hypothetical protein
MLGTIAHVDHGKTTLSSAITQLLAESKHGSPDILVEDDKVKVDNLKSNLLSEGYYPYVSQHYAEASYEVPVPWGWSMPPRPRKLHHNGRHMMPPKKKAHKRRITKQSRKNNR